MLIAALVGITLVCFIVYVCYRYGSAAERLLGTAGTSVVMRLSSFILMCIGVQIVSSGIKAYLETIHHF